MKRIVGAYASVQAHKRRPCLSSSACDTSQWRKLCFHIRSATCARALWATHATPSNGKNCPFALEGWLYHPFVGVARVDCGWEICRLWSFLSFFLFFFSSFIFPPLKITGWSSLLLIFQLRFLFFWFFIFVLGYFVKVLFVFNSIIQSQFVMYFFFQFGSFFSSFFSLTLL